MTLGGSRRFVAMNGGMCSTPAGAGSLHPGAFCFEYPHEVKGGGNWWTSEFAKVVQVKTDVLTGIVQVRSAPPTTGFLRATLVTRIHRAGGLHGLPLRR
jgi:hypothetical protein